MFILKIFSYWRFTLKETNGGEREFFRLYLTGDVERGLSIFVYVCVNICLYIPEKTKQTPVKKRFVNINIT